MAISAASSGTVLVTVTWIMSTSRLTGRTERYWLRSRCTTSRISGGSSSAVGRRTRSEEHTSELQSRGHLVCRLLLEKKKNNAHPSIHMNVHTKTSNSN